MLENSSIREELNNGFAEALQLTSEGKNNEAILKLYQEMAIFVQYLCVNAAIVSTNVEDDILRLEQGDWITEDTVKNFQPICRMVADIKNGRQFDKEEASMTMLYLHDEIKSCIQNPHTPNIEKAKEAIEEELRNIQTPKNDNRDMFSSVLSSSDDLFDGDAPKVENTENPEKEEVNEVNQDIKRFGSEVGKQRKISKLKERQNSKKKISTNEIIKIAIPVSCVILVVIFVKSMLPESEEENTTPVPIETIQTPGVSDETTAFDIDVFLASQNAELPETEPPTTTSSEKETTATELKKYVTIGDGVNVRTEPRGGEIYTTIQKSGTEVDYVKDYDKNWAVIRMDGKDYFIYKELLKEKEG